MNILPSSIPSAARLTVRMRRLTPEDQRRSRPSSVTRPEGFPTYALQVKVRRERQLKELLYKLLERSWTLTRVMNGPSAVPHMVREKYLRRLDKVINTLRRRTRR